MIIKIQQLVDALALSDDPFNTEAIHSVGEGFILGSYAKYLIEYLSGIYKIDLFAIVNEKHKQILKQKGENNHGKN